MYFFARKAYDEEKKKPYFVIIREACEASYKNPKNHTTTETVIKIECPTKVEKILELLKNKQEVEVDDNFQIIGERDTYYHGLKVKENPNKVKIIKSLEKRFEFLYNKLKLLDIIEFITLNNNLNYHGFFITDENKEEVYIKILETQDDQMIGMLERYLELKESLDSLNWYKNETQKIIRDIYELDDNDPMVLKLLDEFVC